MRRIARLIPLVVASTVGAQAAPSDPEIYLMSLSVKGSAVRVGVPANITMRAGYDNQPMFTPDGKHLYFTSVRADSQADIYRYDITTKNTARVTTTAPESEYSATLTPDGKAISVIRVEKDSAQRLWRVPLGGGDSQVIYRDIKPVGYHTWVDANHAALFVLGSPNALVLADARTGKGDTLARDIGRSLVTLPHGGGFSYLSHRGQDWTLTEVRTTRAGKVGYIMPLVTVPRGMDYIAWIGGSAIGGTGSKLMTWTPGSPEWREVVDLAAQGITRISRIVVSRDLRQLAVVAEPSAK
jgi:dipeptidyl aminopeptidase/acylaminoacyl peptidase